MRLLIPFRLQMIGILLLVSLLELYVAGQGQPTGTEPSLTKSDSPRSALSPEEALKTFRLPEDLRIELFAAEPQITSPVAMAFDENGRAYVVEMNDYPLGPKSGRIKLLEDTKGTGRIDKVTVFADKLPFPNGVMPFKGGVLVTAAPDLLYFKDTHGDGKADIRQVVFTGFAEANPQHRFNSPTFNLDNWIYLADGESKTGVRPGNQPDAKPIPLSGSDCRFRPDFSHFELVSARSQYVMTFDDWGHRFINHNSMHLRYPALPHRYLKRNPYLAVPQVVDEIADGGPAATVYPISKLETRFNDPWAAGHFTSACAPTIYRGDALPSTYRGSAFACEPVHNLVHQSLLTRSGSTFQAKSARPKTEFLASTDNWFRPVNLIIGPDGALYVVDMYRAVIEHPQWIPLDVQKKLDLRTGHDKGRIYRIVPKSGVTSVKPRLGAASAGELVKYLEHPNAWWRLTAQRLLIERRDKSALKSLQELARASKSPLARLHALWTLAGLDGLDNELIERTLKDAEPNLRQHGLRLAEPRLAQSGALRDLIVKLAGDENPRVRFQAALSLGELGEDRALDALARIVVRDISDRWTRTAVLSSVPESGAALLAYVRSQHRAFLEKPREETIDWVRQLAGMVGARRHSDEVVELLRLATQDAGTEPSRWQLAALAGLGSSLRSSDASMEKFLKDATVSTRLKAWTKQALAIAASRDRAVAQRTDALVLLTVLPSPEAASALKELLRPQEAQQVQIESVRALAVLPGDQGVVTLLADWNTRTALVRREILTHMLSQPNGVKHLLTALEKGDIRTSELDMARRDQLLRYPDEGIRQRVQKLLGTAGSSDRQKVVQELSPQVLALTGDAVRGQKVYAAHCASCHRLHGQGVDVGPNLATVTGRSKEALLVDILDPSRAADPAYLAYVVEIRNGLVFNGIVVTETASSITLRRADAQQNTILRRDIADIRSTGVSLMPDGLEKVITEQELADLLELLRKGPQK